MSNYVTKISKSGSSNTYNVMDKEARSLISAEATARQEAVAGEATARQEAVAGEATARQEEVSSVRSELAGVEFSVLAYGENLFDYEACVSGYYMEADGDIVEQSNVGYSNYIRVNPGDKVWASFSMLRVCCFDDGKSWVSGGTDTRIDPGAYFTVPSGCYYVILSLFTSAIRSGERVNTGNSALVPEVEYHQYVNGDNTIIGGVPLPDVIESIKKNAGSVDNGVKNNILIDEDSIKVSGTGKYIHNDFVFEDFEREAVVNVILGTGSGEYIPSTSPVYVEQYSSSGSKLKTSGCELSSLTSIDLEEGTTKLVFLFYAARETEDVTTTAEFKNIKIRVGEKDKVYIHADRYEDNLPSYYHAAYTDSDGDPHDDYLKYKAERINELCSDTAAHGDAFFFITDEHWMFNAKNSPGILKYLYQNTRIHKLVNGGDMYQTGYNRGTVNDKDHGFMKAIYEAFKGEVYSTPGNHEYFYDTTFSQVAYDINYRNDHAVWGDEQKQYYYIDNERAKIRYIFLSAFYQYGQGEYDSPNGLADQNQLAWFTNTALNVSEGWGIVIITHMLYNLNDTTKAMVHPSVSDPWVSAINNYSGNGEIICVIQGHTHLDRVTTLVGGTVPLIMTTCDKCGANDGEPDTRTFGTITEQAIDAVIIDRSSKTIYCVRVGSKARDGVDDSIGDQVDERVIVWGE